jgi:hypothetical protein
MADYKPSEKHVEAVTPPSNDSGELNDKEAGRPAGGLMTVDQGIDEHEVVSELPLSEQKRILRKVDWRLIPLLTFLYLVSFVDRSNSTLP